MSLYFLFVYSSILKIKAMSKLKWISIYKLQRLQEEMGFLDWWENKEDEELCILEGIEFLNEEKELLKELGDINSRRNEIINIIMSRKAINKEL